MDIPLAKINKEIKILKRRRCIRKDNTKEFSPVLVTSLGTSLPSETKLWFSVQRTCQFIKSLSSMHEILQIQTLYRWLQIKPDLLHMRYSTIWDRVQTQSPIQIALSTIALITTNVPPILRGRTPLTLRTRTFYLLWMRAGNFFRNRRQFLSCKCPENGIRCATKMHRILHECHIKILINFSSICTGKVSESITALSNLPRNFMAKMSEDS